MKEFSINEYKKLKNEVKEMFTNEKVGAQQSYDFQAKLFKPITDTTKQTAKQIEEKIGDDKQILNNMLAPLTNELMRTNDLQQSKLEFRKAIQEMSGLTDVFEDSDVQKESTPKKEIKIITPIKVLSKQTLTI